MAKPTTVTTGIADAIIKASTLSKLSGMSRIASDLGISPQAVQQWHKQGYVPISRVVEIEALYGIPRHRLVHPKYLEPLRSPQFDVEE